MSETELMAKAIEEAQKSQEPLKCGCVIAKDGEIISSAYNSQRADQNATAHDGTKAIALAGKKLGSKDLEGCVAFCTHEPCTMCLSALVFAKVEALYYAIPLEGVDDTQKRIKITPEELLASAPRPMRLTKDFMREEVVSALHSGR